MSLTNTTSPALLWSFENSNVDSITGLAPSSQISPGPAQLQGSAALVTNAPSPNNTAVYLPNSVNSYMNMPVDIIPASSNLFVEAWFYNITTTSQSYIMVRNNSTQNLDNSEDWGFRINGTTLQLYNWFSDGTVNVLSSTTSVFVSTWTHIAFIFDITNKNYTIFVNGIASGTTNFTGKTLKNTSTNMATFIGTKYLHTAWSSINAYIRDLRVVQGGVVPTASFTPVAAPFSYSSPTYVASMGTTVFTLLGQFITYVPGEYGQAINFPNSTGTGVSMAKNYLIYPVSLNSSIGYTFAFWVNFNVVGIFAQVILSLANSSGGRVFNIYLDGANKLNSYDNTTNIIISPALATVVWYHVAISITTSSRVLYLNGVGTSGTSAVTGTQTAFILGGDLPSLGNFSAWCSYDDLRVYNTALSAAQVLNLYNLGGAPGPVTTMSGLSISPSLWWTFNGTFIESITGINLTSGGTIGVNPFAAGLYGQALYMQTAASYQQYLYNLSPSLATTNGFTASAWINSAGDTVAGIGIYGPTVSGFTYLVRWGTQNGGYPYVNYYDPNNGNLAFRIVQSPTILPYNNWYNIGFVLGGSTNKTLTLYVNGVQKGSTTYGQDIAYSGMNIFRNGNYYIQDLRVYTSALTAAQMNSIYKQSAVPVTSVSLTGTPLFSQLSSAAVASAMGAFSLRAVNGLSPSGTAKVVNIRNGTTSATQDFYADRLGNLLTYPVTGQPLAIWLGGATGYVATWYDQSGKGNHMSCSSTGIQPKIDTANNWIDFKTSAYFDTSANPAAGPVPWDITKTYTVTCHHNTIGNNNGGICGCGVNANNKTNNFRRAMGYYQSYWYNNDQTGGTYAVGNKMTFKWDGTNRYIYVNGSLPYTVASSGWSQSGSVNQLIGKTTADVVMNGEMYSIFMFNTALSDADRALVEAAS